MLEGCHFTRNQLGIQIMGVPKSRIGKAGEYVGLLTKKFVEIGFGLNQGGIKCGNWGTGFLDSEGSHR